jgi:hypothetical protein
MNGRHLTLAEIADAARWPQDDPRRLHLAECVRCRTLCVRHAQFTAPPEHLPPDELRDAEARLEEFLAREVAPTAATVHPIDAGRLRHGRTRARLPSAWFGASALAVAAAALVVGVLVVQRPGGPGDRASGVLRGAAGAGGDAAMRRMAPLTLEAGGVELRWRSAAAADRYEVRLFSPELRTLAVLEASRETVLVLSPGGIAGAAAGDTLLWRVTAFNGEVRLAQTDLGIVRLP